MISSRPMMRGEDPTFSPSSEKASAAAMASCAFLASAIFLINARTASSSPLLTHDGLVYAGNGCEQEPNKEWTQAKVRPHCPFFVHIRANDEKQREPESARRGPANKRVDRFRFDASIIRAMSGPARDNYPQYRQRGPRLSILLSHCGLG